MADTDEDQTTETEDRGDEITSEETSEEVTSEDVEEAKGTKAEADADASEDESEDDSKEHMIPKARLDAKNRIIEGERRKRAEVEQELARLRAEQSKESESTNTPKTPSTVDELEARVDELEQKYLAARRDGDSDTELSVMRELRQIDRQIHKIELDEMKQSAVSTATQQSEYDTTVAAIEDMYPALDPAEDNDAYDKDKVLEVQDLASGFEATGSTPAEALLRAVSYAFPDEGNVASIKKAADKRKTDVAKNVDAAKRTPPDKDKTGLDSDKAGMDGELPDPAKLTEEEFDALPESQKARLRGDFG